MCAPRHHYKVCANFYVCHCDRRILIVIKVKVSDKYLLQAIAEDAGEDGLFMSSVHSWPGNLHMSRTCGFLLNRRAKYLTGISAVNNMFVYDYEAIMALILWF